VLPCEAAELLPTPDVPPVTVPLELLVVPVDAAPLVALGTWPGRAGTDPERVGT
jgi:hypothetical protein